MISREFNEKYFAPGAITFMVAGIIFLCQPWVQFLHTWSVLIMLIGLIAFNISVHIPPPVARADEDDNVSMPPAAKGGPSHG